MVSVPPPFCDQGSLSSVLIYDNKGFDIRNRRHILRFNIQKKPIHEKRRMRNAMCRVTWIKLHYYFGRIGVFYYVQTEIVMS